jgi:hypothetical protein
MAHLPPEPASAASHPQRIKLADLSVNNPMGLHNQLIAPEPTWTKRERAL